MMNDQKNESEHLILEQIAHIAHSTEDEVKALREIRMLSLPYWDGKIKPIKGYDDE